MSRNLLLFILVMVVVVVGTFFLKTGRPKTVRIKTDPEVSITSSDALKILGSLTKKAYQKEMGTSEASPSSSPTKEIENFAKDTAADAVEELKKSFPNLTEISQSKLTEKLSAEVFQSLLTKFSSANPIVSSGIVQACQEIIRKNE